MAYLPDLDTNRQITHDDQALSVRSIGTVGSVGAFGVNISQPETPMVSLNFHYGLPYEYLNVSASNGGLITGSNGTACCSSGQAANGYASLQSKTANHYVSGLGGRFKFAGYFISGGLPQSTTTVGVGDDLDGFFFGYSGSQFGVMRRSNSVETWAPQTSWSLDRMDGHGPSGQVLDPTLGNVYMISYQWLGFGAINFYVEDGPTGKFYPVHRIGYANTARNTSVSNPNLPISCVARNWGSTGSVYACFSSVAAMVEGNVPVLGIQRSASGKDLAVFTEVPIITLLNSGTLNGLPNRRRLRVNAVSVMNRDATAGGSFRLVIGATLTNSSFAPVSATLSPANIDTSATAGSGGREIYFLGIAPDTSQFIELTDTRINPNETLTVFASGTAAMSVALAGIMWTDEV